MEQWSPDSQSSRPSHETLDESQASPKTRPSLPCSRLSGSSFRDATGTSTTPLPSIQDTPQGVDEESSALPQWKSQGTAPVPTQAEWKNITQPTPYTHVYEAPTEPDMIREGRWRPPAPPVPPTSLSSLAPTLASFGTMALAYPFIQPLQVGFSDMQTAAPAGPVDQKLGVFLRPLENCGVLHGDHCGRLDIRDAEKLSSWKG